jgi:hypothetical protein
MLTYSRAAIAFSAVVIVWFVSGCKDRSVPYEDAFSKSSELTRVTSPNGQLDAVLINYIYGPPAGGGVDFDVYIVPKGVPVHMKAGREVFSADPMTNEQLVWKRDHLLEIHYDIADIHLFRNLWGLHEIEDTGTRGERDYEVEIRLMPASDSSALTPDGTFRHRGSD